VCFKPDEDDEEKSNVLKRDDNGNFVEFKPFGQIEQHIYLEHSIKYYYDQYLKDPSKKKTDWDYNQYYKEKEEVVFAWLVILIKVNGTVISSRILMQDKHQFETTHINFGNIWYRPSWAPKEGKKMYEEQAKENFFPLLRYLRDSGKPGKYKVEVEVYPGKLECKSDTERSDELICKGEFTLAVSADEAKEISQCGGPKDIPKNNRYYIYMGRMLEDK